MKLTEPKPAELKLAESRLAELRTKRKLSQKEFGKILNVAQNTVSNWENGNREIGGGTLIKIADYFNVTTDYILGKDDKHGGYEEARNANAAKPDPAKRKRGAARIPVFGYVAAGIPIGAVEDVIGYEEITDSLAATGEFFALKLKGDSMEPRMEDGDVVIVRRQSAASAGDIVIALINGDEAACKKFKRTPDGILLLSLNSDYDPLYYSNREVESIPVTILGKVVELRGKFE